MPAGNHGKGITRSKLRKLDPPERAEMMAVAWRTEREGTVGRDIGMISDKRITIYPLKKVRRWLYYPFSWMERMEKDDPDFNKRAHMRYGIALGMRQLGKKRWTSRKNRIVAWVVK